MKASIPLIALSESVWIMHTYIARNNHRAKSKGLLKAYSSAVYNDCKRKTKYQSIEVRYQNDLWLNAFGIPEGKTTRVQGTYKGIQSLVE